VSQPEQPLRFFLDRSLGRKAVPEALRAEGWDVITLAEHYGMPADEQVADTDWIEEAAQREWPILMKDKRIRHRQAEITAVSPLGRWALTTRAATDDRRGAQANGLMRSTRAARAT
jgi:hypothetical protein